MIRCFEKSDYLMIERSNNIMLEQSKLRTFDHSNDSYH